MRKVFTILALLLMAALYTAAQGCTKILRSDATSIVTVKHTGYTVCYDGNRHCPVFVEWTLTKEHLAIEAASRTDEFIPDPDIASTPESRCYSRSGYDRGHMAPAADFKWSEKVMRESFYTSNICPQRNELNAGAWLTLEKACRRWAKYYGTVWIVCGPVFDDAQPRTIGSADCRIAVPTAFYKVVLKQYKGKWYAMGWIMPNADIGDGFDGYAMSVDKVEALTGLDFFSWLDDADEREAERQTDTKYWN